MNTAVDGWSLLHLELGEALPALPAHPEVRGYHVFFWMDDTLLGETRVPEGLLPMPAVQLRERALRAVTPAVGELLFGEPMSWPPPPAPPGADWPARFRALQAVERPLAEVRRRLRAASEEQQLGKEASYPESYYEELEADTVASARAVVPLVMEQAGRPRRVIDVGCGVGAWLAAFQGEGVAEVRGLDGPWIDPEQLHIPAEAFTAADLEQPFVTGEAYDLVVSLEVAEHLPAEAAEAFVKTLVGLGPVVLFSAAVPGQGGTRHLNERWPAYWAARFGEHGYVPVDSLRPRLWTDRRVAWWYRQNALFFVDEGRLGNYPALEAARASATPAVPLPLVHPERFASVQEGHDWLAGREASLQKRVAELSKGQAKEALRAARFERQAARLYVPGTGRLSLQKVLGVLPGLAWRAVRRRIVRRDP